MIRIRCFVNEERRWPVNVENNDVQIPIVIDVAERGTPARLQAQIVQPRAV